MLRTCGVMRIPKRVKTAKLFAIWVILTVAQVTAVATYESLEPKPDPRDLAGHVAWHRTLARPGARALPAGASLPAGAARKRGLQDRLERDLTDEWAVLVDGGDDVAREVARDLGLEYGGKIGTLEGYYHFRHPVTPGRRRRGRAANWYKDAFKDDGRVAWWERQTVRIRPKREFISKREEENAYRQVRHTDKFWKQQWYLKDTRDSLATPKLDLHVIPVWAKNITGRGVVVTILDDGIEHNHTDLRANYDPLASYDLNDDDEDPMPRYDYDNFNKHGTRCAGEVAMAADNGKCGVGVAYNAKIGGVRMLDGIVTDRLEAAALSFNMHHVDIMSASWGPEDDGSTVEGPGKLATEAFLKGVTEGRDGKGLIYVWASGNGGGKDDNCDCDGYTGSIYTLSISSASQGCESPWYAEKCASTMATTYSSGTFEEQKIISTDLHDMCTLEHTGTSASAPLAAGIFALLLESNPELTWRDVQHLVAWTSEYASLDKNPGWKKNGAGFWVNTRFGFGLLNAAELTNAAEPGVFESVPEKRVCIVSSNKESGLPRNLHSGHELFLNISTSGCRGQSNEVRYLEHMQLMLDMAYSRRGDIEIFLTSPMGTETTLLSARPGDESEEGFLSWPFMSVHNWGEDPEGIWILRVMDGDISRENTGTVENVTLVMHGTLDMPDHVKRAGGKRKYNYNYNNVQNTRDNSDSADETGMAFNAMENVDELTQEMQSSSHEYPSQDEAKAAAHLTENGELGDVINGIQQNRQYRNMRAETDEGDTGNAFNAFNDQLKRFLGQNVRREETFVPSSLEKTRNIHDTRTGRRYTGLYLFGDQGQGFNLDPVIGGYNAISDPDSGPSLARQQTDLEHEWTAYEEALNNYLTHLRVSARTKRDIHTG